MKEAAKKAIDKYGVGSGAVRTISGNMEIHEELDERLAKFKREEAALVFQSGFLANLGVIQAITDRGDLIISDELNHASIIDGVRLSRADKAVFPHSDMKALEQILKERRKDYNEVLIITDGVFSMDGDIANLPEIVRLAKKYDAKVYVDDAHGSGVLGENGRGTVDHFNLHGQVDYIMGRLSDIKNNRENCLDKIIDEMNLDAILFLEWTSIAAIAGYPSIIVPAGFTTGGTAEGITFVGKAFSEGTLIRLAYAYEQASKKRVKPK